MISGLVRINSKTKQQEPSGKNTLKIEWSFPWIIRHSVCKCVNIIIQVVNRVNHIAHSSSSLTRESSKVAQMKEVSGKPVWWGHINI